MRSKEPQLDRLSAVATALAFGLVALLLPAVPPPLPAPPPVALPIVPAVPVTPVVLTEATPAEPGAAPTVALTFDDGPDPRWTPQVLDLLARHQAVATFCMVGEKAERHPELVRDVVAAGMRLCNHSHSHDERLSTRDEDRMTGDVVGTQRDIAAAGSAPVPYFRAPGGSWSEPMLRIAADAAMQPLGWSVDPRDWRQPGAAAIVTAVREQVHPGAIVLLHDGGGRREQSVAALEQLLPWLTAQGYRFVFPTP